MVVDLGGGTADLVMHGFKQFGSIPKLVELTKGESLIITFASIDCYFVACLSGRNLFQLSIEKRAHVISFEAVEHHNVIFEKNGLIMRLLHVTDEYTVACALLENCSLHSNRRKFYGIQYINICIQDNHAILLG
jgi:hypothetical protein